MSDTLDASPSVSVVVVNWNRKDFLRNCLRSLAAQTYRDFEVIVVENGSTDGSAAMVENEFGAAPGLRVRLIRNATNLGFCGGNNRGFAVSRSRLVALLNNDAEADASWLESLVDSLDSRPDIGMAASKILVYENPTRIDKVGHLIYPDGQNRGRGTGEIDRGQYDQPEEVAWPDGCAAMFRREVLDEAGGFDEDFFAFGDDAELGLRARIAGWKCLYVPRAVVRHHRGSTASVGSMRRAMLIERNRVLLAAKLFPWSLLWLNPFYYLARVAAGLWSAARNKGETARYSGIRGKLRLAFGLIEGDLQALWLLPKILRKRRDIRKIQKLTPRQVHDLILQYRIPLKVLSEQAYEQVTARSASRR